MNSLQKGWLLAAIGLGIALAPAFGLMAVNTTVMTAGFILFVIGMVAMFADIGFFNWLRQWILNRS